MHPECFEFASRGTTYYLHSRTQKMLNRTDTMTIYFFAKIIRPEQAVKELPEGYEVATNTKNGVPFLRRKK